MMDFETFYETTNTGPVVGEGPGKNGRDIYRSALEFVARHHKVMRSDVRPMFDPQEWVQAKPGTELPVRVKFLINHMLVAELRWHVKSLSKSGRPKGNWVLQSMYLNR